MPKKKPVPEPTFAVALGLWDFTLSWLTQCRPSDEEALIAIWLFKRLGPAVVADTGLENLHHLRDLRTVQMGDTSLFWLREARATLPRLYSYFEDEIKYLIDPSGVYPETWDKF